MTPFTVMSPPLVDVVKERELVMVIPLPMVNRFVLELSRLPVMAIWPPESVMAPDPAPTLRLEMLWELLTPMVPAPKPFVELPRFRVSLTVVAVRAGATNPAGSVLINAVVPQVPLAVPKPAVVPLASQ